jgi:hypothetical protein
MFSPLLQWENNTFGDIHMIDMQENMNEGKSYEYFASMAQMYGKGEREKRRWDYVMKVDDDTFLHLGNLIEKLRGIRREKLWFVGILAFLFLFSPALHLIRVVQISIPSPTVPLPCFSLLIPLCFI